MTMLLYKDITRKLRGNCSRGITPTNDLVSENPRCAWGFPLEYDWSRILSGRLKLLYGIWVMVVICQQNNDNTDC